MEEGEERGSCWLTTRMNKSWNSNTCKWNESWMAARAPSSSRRSSSFPLLPGQLLGQGLESNHGLWSCWAGARTTSLCGAPPWVVLGDGERPSPPEMCFGRSGYSRRPPRRLRWEGPASLSPGSISLPLFGPSQLLLPSQSSRSGQTFRFPGAKRPSPGTIPCHCSLSRLRCASLLPKNLLAHTQLAPPRRSGELLIVGAHMTLCSRMKTPPHSLGRDQPWR